MAWLTGLQIVQVPYNKKGTHSWNVTELTNSIKAWFLLAPTLHFVLTTLPNGFPSSMSSSSVHSHGKFLKCSTFDGGWVYRNCGWLETEAISTQTPTNLENSTRYEEISGMQGHLYQLYLIEIEHDLTFCRVYCRKQDNRYFVKGLMKVSYNILKGTIYIVPQLLIIVTTKPQTCYTQCQVEP